MPYLKEQINALKQAAEMRHSQNKVDAPTVQQQLESLLGSIHPTLLDRPWLIKDFVVRLCGKYRKHPHPQEVGEALRALGWKRVRLWKNGDGGCRVWISPKYEE